MAKRRRLEPARLLPDPAPDTGPDNTAVPPETGLETKSMFPGQFPPASRRSPIADVAADAATAAALTELSQTLQDARREGRLVQRLPLDQINESYLVRDRMVIDPEEMATLCNSLADRGQQTPVEVVDLAGENGTGIVPTGGRWGLISGWRRLMALRSLNETGSVPDTILAIVRPAQEAALAYRAMVEENEIRAALSNYERARIVARSVDLGVYASDQIGLRALFSSAPRSKRSKIGSFIRIVRTLEPVLRFPTEMTERTGLALAGALESEPGEAIAFRVALLKAMPTDAAAEQAIIMATVREVLAEKQIQKAGPESVKPVSARPARAPGSPLPLTLRHGLTIEEEPDQIILQGPALLNPALRARLMGMLRRL